MGKMSQPIWYLMDEVGATILHSDTPNVKVMTFKHCPSKDLQAQDVLDISVMWPLK